MADFKLKLSDDSKEKITQMIDQLLLTYPSLEKQGVYALPSKCTCGNSCAGECTGACASGCQGGPSCVLIIV